MSKMDQPPPPTIPPSDLIADAEAQAPATAEAPEVPPERASAEEPACGPSEAPEEREPKPDLHALIERMQPSGMTKMVFDNCQLASHAADRWELVLAEEHDILLRDNTRASVRDMVSAYMGREMRVDIVVGKPDEETPGERRRRLDAARQRAAEQAVAADETVQSLLRVFDGEIGSVQPLDDREYRSP